LLLLLLLLLLSPHHIDYIRWLLFSYDVDSCFSYAALQTVQLLASFQKGREFDLYTLSYKYVIDTSCNSMHDVNCACCSPGYMYSINILQASIYY